MKLTDQKLGAMVARLERSSFNESPGIDPELIARAAEGQLSEQEKLALPGLLASHSEMHKELQLAIALRQELRGGTPSPSPTAQTKKSAARLWPLAAALIIGAGGVSWMTVNRQSTGPQPTLRAPAGEVQPVSGSLLQSAPHLMSWPARSLRNQYRLEVRNGSGGLVWQSDWITGNEVQYTGPALEPGTYSWRAVAVDDSDPQLVPTHEFRVE